MNFYNLDLQELPIPTRYPFPCRACGLKRCHPESASNSEGQHFMALKGGPAHRFTSAISPFVDCGTQEEVDDLWCSLSEGGSTGRCGWLTDKFGLFLADHSKCGMIPTMLVPSVLKAMVQMSKIDLGGLKRAYAGE